jgi:hypothetical protein
MIWAFGPRFTGRPARRFWCEYEFNTEHRNVAAAIKEGFIH